MVIVILNYTLLLIIQASEKYGKGGPNSTANNEVTLFYLQHSGFCAYFFISNNVRLAHMLPLWG